MSSTGENLELKGDIQDANDQPSAKRMKVDEISKNDERNGDDLKPDEMLSCSIAGGKQLSEPSKITDADANEIAKLVAFYFGDSNFRRDKFLQNEASKDEDGYVKISVLLTFNKLKALTNDVKVVADAVESHTPSVGVIALNSTRDSIRRILPLGPDTSSQRTAFVAGFDTEAAVPSVDTLIALFSEGDLGEVLYVRRRMGLANPRDKQGKKRFIGSVFVEYANEASVAKICARCPWDNKQSAEKQPKDDVTAAEEKSAEPHATNGTMSMDTSEQEKQAKDDVTVSEKTSAEPHSTDDMKNEDTSETVEINPLIFQSRRLQAMPLRQWLENERKQRSNERETKKENVSVQYDVGKIVKLDGVGTNVTRALLKDTFSVYGDVKFVDLPVGATSAFVRFDNAEDSKKAVTELDTDALEKALSSPVKISVLEGDEEKAYWTKVMQAHRNSQKRESGKRQKDKRKRKS